MILMPIGIINERHEPPVYYGVETSLHRHGHHPVDVVRGRGRHPLVKSVRGWRYRAFVAGAARRGGVQRRRRVFARGRQKGAEANVGSAAVTGRLEYVGIPWA
jgi:hypothetical protein